MEKASTKFVEVVCLVSYDVDEVISALVDKKAEEGGKTVYPVMRELLDYLTHLKLFVALAVDGDKLHLSVVDTTNEYNIKDLEKAGLEPKHHIAD